MKTNNEENLPVCTFDGFKVLDRIDQTISSDPFPMAWAGLPLHPDLLELRHRGHTEIWTDKRFLADFEACAVLQPMGRQWV